MLDLKKWLVLARRICAVVFEVVLGNALALILILILIVSQTRRNHRLEAIEYHRQCLASNMTLGKGYLLHSHHFQPGGVLVRK